MRSPTFDVLFGRFLTRSGDQAWDFALPLALVALLPQHTPLVIALFFASKLSTLLLFPRLAMVIDDWRRLKTATFGTSLQVGGVVLCTLCVLALARSSLAADTATTQQPFSPADAALLGLLTLGSVAANLGQNLMDVAVGNDWLPGLVPAEGLATINSRLRQVDLLTEVGAPVVAGVLLGTLALPGVPVAGFLVVALWNVLSFVPEIALLRRVVRASDILSRKTDVPRASTQSLVRRAVAGWRDFFSHATAPVMIASSLLWLSVLSPHGLLLTTALKSDWGLSEAHLGLFRGAGAAVGLLATLAYPPVRARLGLVRGSMGFLGFQAAMVVAAGVCFVARGLHAWAVVAFLACVVVSRIGLYGFLLGETEIRQVSLAEDVRGRINGVATALTSGATLLLFGLGSVMPPGRGFALLVALSVAAVVGAAWVFRRWSRALTSGEVPPRSHRSCA